MYDGTFEQIQQQLAVYAPDIKVARCFWGGLGARLNSERASIPNLNAPEASIPNSDVVPALAEETENEQILLWEKLYRDPLFELGLLSLREPSQHGQAKQQRAKLYSDLLNLELKPEQQKILLEAGIADVFPQAIKKVINSNLYNQALGTASELSSEYYGAVARAIVATAMFDCSQQDKYVKILNNSQLRDQVVELLSDGEYGLGDWISKPLTLLAQHATTFVTKHKRSEITNAILTLFGDILLYQTRGEQIREFIQQTIEQAEPPVVLLTHSLGGVASIDLLVKQQLTQVELLVTVGSQAPILYEINCLHSLTYSQTLPTNFPKWLNIYDECDFLSFIGAAIFPNKVKDQKVNNEQPFPRAHDAYWENEETWQAIIKELP